MAKKPKSFNIFVIAMSIVAVTTLASLFIADILLAMVLAVILFIAMIFTIIGFISGLKYKGQESKSYNKVGLIGNLVLFVTIVIMMFFALL
jgi:hypothetical protein